MPAVLEIPIELAVLGLRLLLVLALYAFLAMVLRDIHRNWNQNASREDVALRLIVTSSGSDAVRVGQQFEVHQRCTIGRRTELAV
ncbi:MAG: hypothetical protein ACKVVP_16480, partial [Chloroflexota bacterium]